jgi:hypothetical protein
LSPFRHCERKRSNPGATHRESWIASSQVLLAMTVRHASVFSRHGFVRALQIHRPPKTGAHATLKRGRREDRVRAAPAVSCAMGSRRNVHMSIQVQRKHSGLPCTMVLRLIRAPWWPCCATIASGFLPASLTPALVRQDHTISPCAPRHLSCDATRPSLPAPNVS